MSVGLVVESSNSRLLKPGLPSGTLHGHAQAARLRILDVSDSNVSLRVVGVDGADKPEPLVETEALPQIERR